MKKLILRLILLYQQFLSKDHSYLAKERNLPPFCPFFPSCSQYMYEAIELHGLWYGLCLGIRRILRCHPWTKGGIDIVPRKK